MQAAAQPFIDSSISKTVNCPEDIAFEDFVDVYRQGYAMGCKGLTTYRPNPVTGAVLAVTTSVEAKDGGPRLASRPETLVGATYKLKWPESAHAVYVTINDIDGPEGRQPFEIFINSKNMEHYAWTLALTRMISAVFRRGGDVSFVAEELKAVFDPRGGGWVDGRYVPSLLAAIGAVIERHLAGGHAAASLAPPLPTPAVAPEPKPGVAVGESCPRCGAFELVRQEGCDTCFNCGYSRCA
jgi:ribonucleoside-diphosphate reductase alpha chain